MSISSTVRRMYQTLNAELHAAESPLTDTQIEVLECIARAPGGSQTAVTEATGVDRSTLTEVVRRMVKNKIVTRTRDKEDTRAYVLGISENGKAVLKKSLAARSKAEAALKSKYPALQQIAAE